MQEPARLPEEAEGATLAHLLGSVVILSSQVEHVMRHAANMGVYPPINALSKPGVVAGRLQRSWEEHVKAGRMTEEEKRTGDAWVERALSLLKRRNTFVHARWRGDDQAPNGMTGLHVPSGRTVGGRPELHALGLDLAFLLAEAVSEVAIPTGRAVYRLAGLPEQDVDAKVQGIVDPPNRTGLP